MIGYKNHGLNEGGIDLNYIIESVLNCFNSFIPPPRANMNNQTFRQPTFPHDIQKTQHHSAMPSSSSIFRFLDQGSGQIFYSSPMLKVQYIKNTKSVTILNVNIRYLRKKLLNLEAFIYSLDGCTT